MFTPTKDGLFRASIYVEVTQAAPQQGVYLYPYFSYTNDSGMNLMNGTSFPAQIWVINDVSGIVTFRAKANIPVMVVSFLSGTATGYSFNLYAYIERLF